MLNKVVLATVASGASAAWSIISGNVGSGATGLSCFDANTCIIASSDGFLGYQIYLSSDGGVTWPTTCPNQDGYLFPMYDAAAYGSFAAVAGQLSAQFSLNKGQFFNTSIGGAGGVYARTVGASSGFGFAGTFGSANGVAVSTDGGITFAATDASATLQFPAQAAVFLDVNTWFVVGGTAPAGGNDQASDQPTTTGTGTTTTGTTTGTTTIGTGPDFYSIKRVVPGLEFHTVKGKPAHHVFHYPAEVAVAAGGRSMQSSNSTWNAQIVATTDGGKTFTSQLVVSGLILLGIDCLDANTCAAVGTNGDANGGAFIYSTSDGGATWTQTYNDTTPGAQLADVRAGPAAGEFWAVGGTITSTAISAEFIHSTDGGKTWAIDAASTLANYFGTGIDGALGGAQPYLATVVDVNDNSLVAKLA